MNFMNYMRPLGADTGALQQCRQWGKWGNGKSFIDFHWALRCNNLHACLCMSDYTGYTCTPSFSPSLLLSITHSLALHSLNFMPKQWHAINLNGFALRLKQNASTNPRNVFSAPEACVCESGCCTTLPAGLSKHLIRQAPTHLLSLTPPPALPCSFSLLVENVLKFYILFPFFFIFCCTQVFVNTRNICNV